MNLIPVLVLWCIYIGSGDGWFFHQYQKGSGGRSSDEQTDDETESPVSGKEVDWDTRGKMLFATEIITTTEMMEIPDNSTLDFEEDAEIDNITEIIELMASSPQSLEINNSSSTTPIPCIIKISSPQKVHIVKHRKGKHKADTTKRQTQKSRLRRYMGNKKSFRNAHKRNGTKIGKNRTIIEKLKRYNTHITSLEQNTTKDNPRDKMVLDQDEESYSIRNKNGPQINENYKSVKRKREYTAVVPLRPKDSYLENNLWETPTCEIMGDGVDHVRVQYSKPFTASSNHRSVIHPKNYGEERKEVKNIDLMETINNGRETLADRDSEPDMEQYNIKMYDPIKAPRIHINNFMNSHGQAPKTGDDPFDIFNKSRILSKNPELMEDKIYTNYSTVDNYNYPTVEDILLDRRIKPFKSIYNNNGFRNISDHMIKYKRPSAKIMHCRKNAHHLPMNITIAMKHLLKHYNPTDLNISNSSFLTPDGTLKFSIELRKGSGRDV